MILIVALALGGRTPHTSTEGLEVFVGGLRTVLQLFCRTASLAVGMAAVMTNGWGGCWLLSSCMIKRGMPTASMKLAKRSSFMTAAELVVRPRLLSCDAQAIAGHEAKLRRNPGAGLSPVPVTT